MSDAYGQQFGERMRAEHVQAISRRGWREPDLAVTEIRCDDPSPPAMSCLLQREDAFLAGLLLRDFPHHEYWEDGKQSPVFDLRAGEIIFWDLKREPVVFLDKPYHSLHFYLSRTALDTIADDANAPRISDLSYKPEPDAGTADVTISSLGSLVLRALSHPDQANPLFVDHVLLAFGAHIAQTYGGMRPVSRPVRGGLAPWQERRAKQMIAANLGGVTVEELARECRLSMSHFSRAFHRSVGLAPHRWLMKRRIEVAKEKLRDGRWSLTDGCGRGLRLLRSKSPHASFHTSSWRKSGRVASGSRKLNPAARRNGRTAP